eukprot:4624890-Prymnesium_polylepis.1
MNHRLATQLTRSNIKHSGSGACDCRDRTVHRASDRASCAGHRAGHHILDLTQRWGHACVARAVGAGADAGPVGAEIGSHRGAERGAETRAPHPMPAQLVNSPGHSSRLCDAFGDSTRGKRVKRTIEVLQKCVPRQVPRRSIYGLDALCLRRVLTQRGKL